MNRNVANLNGISITNDDRYHDRELSDCAGFYEYYEIVNGHIILRHKDYKNKESFSIWAENGYYFVGIYGNPTYRTVS